MPTTCASPTGEGGRGRGGHRGGIAEHEIQNARGHRDAGHERQRSDPARVFARGRGRRLGLGQLLAEASRELRQRRIALGVVDRARRMVRLDLSLVIAKDRGRRGLVAGPSRTVDRRRRGTRSRASVPATSTSARNQNRGDEAIAYRALWQGARMGGILKA
jgi:hypothetical protein